MYSFRPICRAFQARFFLLLAALVFALSLSEPTFAANGSVVYTYDALGRVTSASYDTNVIIAYTYDANGNRLSQLVNINTAPLTWTDPQVTPCTSNCWDGALWN